MRGNTLVGYCLKAVVSVWRFSLSVLLTLQQNGPKQTRIINGTDVLNPEKYPYFATFWGNGYMCGGTLIAPDIVISAAHCQYAAYDSVDIGRFNYADRLTETIPIIEQIFYPLYPNRDNPFSYDIMLLKLQYNSTKPYLKLDERGTIYGLNAIGFGATSTNFSTAFPTALQQKTLIYIENDLCQEKYGTNVTISDDMLCTSVGSYSYGDNGGPLISKYEFDRLIGITSS